MFGEFFATIHSNLFLFFKFLNKFFFIRFFQLFASGLQQKLELNMGILGYLEADVKKEVKRASKLVRIYVFLNILHRSAHKQSESGRTREHTNILYIEKNCHNKSHISFYEMNVYLCFFLFFFFIHTMQTAQMVFMYVPLAHLRERERARERANVHLILFTSMLVCILRHRYIFSNRTLSNFKK